MRALLIAFIALRLAVASVLHASSIDWVREYNGPGNDPDRIAAIATDLFGNIIVAGTSAVAGTQDDFVVIKFSPSGDTIWVRRIDNPTTHYETCIALAVDSEDNIVITGTTFSVAANRDLMTAKLNSDGDLLWYRSFDGPAHGDDYPSAVVTDLAGNICVTGSTATSPNWPAFEDYITVKYSPSGNELWVRTYDGGGEWDFANDIDVDNAGNVYVTGNSNTSPTVPGIHCTTIKYLPNGTADWVRTAYDAAPNTYGAGLELEIDEYQNVYVAATLTEGFDVHAMLIKYDPAGDTLWQRVYLRSLTRWDSVADMSLAPGGGVVITGSGTDVYTARYTEFGDTLWSRHWSQGTSVYRKANALAVNADGNVFVVGCWGTSTDYHQALTLGYSANGDSIFAGIDSMLTYTRGEGIDIFAADDGNIYTGCRIATSSIEDIALMKYAASGALLWKEIYSGPGSASDFAADIVLDAQGNSYVTGSSRDLSSDVVTVKYSADGFEEWRSTFDGPLHGDDGATAEVLDNSGNLIVVGIITTARSAFGDALYDYLIIKYDANGDTLWLRTYDGGGSFPSDDATAVAVDAENNIYVTGDSYGVEEDYTTIKYSPSGELIWSRRYNGTGNGEDHATALALGETGNVFVTGSSDGGWENDDIVTISYSTNGDLQWVNRYDGPPGDDEDGGEAICVGPDGLACVAGWSPSLSTASDIMVIKYTSTGDTAWTRRIDGLAHTTDVGTSLVLDDLGNLYIAGRVGIGSSDCTSQATNAVVIKYSPDGELQWTWSMDNPQSCSNSLFGLALDASDNVYAVGRSGYAGLYQWEDFHQMLTIKLTSSGELVWVDEYEGSEAGQASGIALGLDSSGNLLVTGITSGLGSDQDITTIKYRKSNFCGDADGSGIVNISDAVYLILYIFSGGTAPNPLLSGDANCSGGVNISDAVYLINYIFSGGTAPCSACP